MPTEHEDRIEFHVLQTENKRGVKRCTADSVEQWYRYCLDNGLQEVMFMFISPAADKNRYARGFSNAVQIALVCIFEKRVTYYTAQWKYNSSQKKWNVLYTEQK